jgi:hypothetical protein
MALVKEHVDATAATGHGYRRHALHLQRIAHVDRLKLRARGAESPARRARAPLLISATTTMAPAAANACAPARPMPDAAR